jgi:WD40 repeat protein
MTRRKIKVGDISGVSGEVNIAAGNIVKNIQTIYERSLTASEEAAQGREFERQLLAQGVGIFIQNLKNQASQKTGEGGPYKGLLAYNLNEAEIFFGRQQATGDLLKCLKRDPLTILQAESGAGKTSLLQAGVAAHLIANGHLAIRMRTFKDDPGEFIKRTFLPDLRQAPELAQAPLREFLRQVCGILGPEHTLYLLLDQFEEFFNLLDKDDRKPFYEALADCLNDSSLKVNWIIALREEDFGKLSELEAFGVTPFKNTYRLNRLGHDEAQQALVEPAKLHSIEFKPELVEDILKELESNGEIAPTQLQLVCSALTQDLPDGQIVTREMYQKLGGAEGILRDYLKHQLDQLPRDEQSVSWKVLRALITADRQRAVRTYNDLAEELRIGGVTKGQLDTVLARLVERRLVSIQPSAVETLELVHDYLVKEIELDPKEQARKAAQELLDQEVRTYQRYKTLLSAERLAIIEPHRTELRFSPEAETLYIESQKVARRERRARERRRNALFIGLVVVALAMSLLAFWGQRNAIEASRNAETAQAASTLAVAQQATAQANAAEAQRQAKIARAGELAAQSVASREKNFLLSSLLGIEAFRMNNNLQTFSALLDNAQANPQLIRFLTEHKNAVRSVAFSPDGKTLASGSPDGTIILWDVASRKPIGEPFSGHMDWVTSVAFSPDGKTLASGSWDHTIHLWDVASLKPIGEPLTGHTDSVTSVAFSPDGKTLASGSWDHTILLWDVASRKLIGQPLTGHTDSVTSVAFSPDGKTLASGGYDNTIILWDVETGQLIGQPLTGHRNWVTSVAFSPDGRTLASGSLDHTILLWDVASRKPIGQPLTGHKDIVNTVAFSPNGKTLISGSRDNTILLWDVVSRKLIGGPLTGHSDSVTSVSFSPDGRTLASGSWDNTILLWDVASRKPIDGPLKGHADDVTSVAFSPDDWTLASGSFDTSIILWSLDSPSLIEITCKRVGRNFTRDEWNLYFPDQPYPTNDQLPCPNLPADQ